MKRFCFEPFDRLGVSLILNPASHHRTGIDLHWLRPNELITLRIGKIAVCLFFPCLRKLLRLPLRYPSASE